MLKAYSSHFDPKTPNTDAKATPVDLESVTSARVVHVLDGEHRNAIITGTFEVAPNQGELNPDAVKFQVVCYWFNCKPENSWMEVKIKPGMWREQYDYTGSVTRNIARIRV